MNPSQLFFSEKNIALKVCGVTQAEDAESLVSLGVEAIGVNFWQHSKRYCAPEQADFLKKLKGRIMRVGVFVNADPDLVLHLLEQDYIDYAQFHGDEDADYLAAMRAKNVPFIRAVGLKSEADIKKLCVKGCSALLLDAHAPGVYGGTGKTCDWTIIKKVKNAFPSLPLMLAGGITVENVEAARQLEDIIALDVASGAESSPGKKDMEKVKQLAKK